MTPHLWERVKDTFATLVSLTNEERAARLGILREEEPELAREVASLLAAHDDPSPGIVPDAFGVGAGFRAEPIDYAGRTVGAYRIVREIGRGGMGAVFLAERADGAFERQVALKVVRHGLAGEQLERRFRRERQILATLSHPHIAHLLDGGVSADGEPFFVMEYVDGVRIDRYCAREQLSARARLKLFLLVCRAVAYAHGRLVLHRDLKPSNILVSTDGVPKLLDFGIAKLLDDTAPGDQTATELRAFTPDYAAPEQVRGEQALTPAVDVFSLGTLLSVLLERPALDGGAGARVANTGDVADAARPRQTGSRQIGPQKAGQEETGQEEAGKPAIFAREIQAVVAMARRLEPERRYRSARELGEDIERLLDGKPVAARPDSLAYRASKLIERRRTAVRASLIAIAALLVGIISAAVYAGWDVRRSEAFAGRGAGTGSASGAPGTAGASGTTGAPGVIGPRAILPLGEARSVAVLPLKLVGGPSALSLLDARARIDDQALRVGMADSIVTRLSQVRHLTVRPTSATIRFLDQPYDAVAVGRELRVDSVLEGTLQRSGDELRTNLQLVDVASGNVVWAESLTSDRATVLGGQESLASRVSQMLAFNASAVAGQVARPSQGTTNLAAQDAFLRGGLAMATAARQITNVLAARDAYEQAVRLDPNFALALAALANTYTTAGSLTLLAPRDAYPAAERAARRALAIDPDLGGAYGALAAVESDFHWNWTAAEENHRRALALLPNSGIVHQDYSELLARLGRFSEASAHADLAQQLDPTRINFVAVRALHYYYEHKFGDAIAQSRKALAKDPTTYLAWLYLAAANAAQGTYDEGLAAAKEATSLTGGATPDLFVTGLNTALKNDTAQTDAVLRRLRALSRSSYVDPVQLAAIHAYRGDNEQAFAALEEAFASRSYWLTSLKVNPSLDSLHGDPRYAAMLRRVNLQ